MLSQSKLEEFKNVKRQKEALDEIIQTMQLDIISELEKLNLTDLTVGVYKVKFSACERENFNLKDAKKALSQNLLLPFITKSYFNRLTVN